MGQAALEKWTVDAISLWAWVLEGIANLTSVCVHI
jgi:hypothetical protein